MRYVAAYLLAVLGGNTSPSAKDVKAILGSVGIEADDERLNKVGNLTTENQKSPPGVCCACGVVMAPGVGGALTWGSGAYPVLGELPTWVVPLCPPAESPAGGWVGWAAGLAQWAVAAPPGGWLSVGFLTMGGPCVGWSGVLRVCGALGLWT